jgi:hypothetical protein
LFWAIGAPHPKLNNYTILADRSCYFNWPIGQQKAPALTEAVRRWRARKI